MFGDKKQSDSEVQMALGNPVAGVLDEGKDFLERNKASLDEFILD